MQSIRYNSDPVRGLLRLKAGARPWFYVELIGGNVVANVHLLKDKSERVKYDLSKAVVVGSIHAQSWSCS